MKLPRFSIAGLLGLIVVLALGFAALRSPSYLWANAVFSLALGLLTIALLGVLFRQGRRRAFWSGFALGGWLYLLAIYGPWFGTDIEDRLITTALLDLLHEQLTPPEPPPAPPPPAPPPPTTTPVDPLGMDAMRGIRGPDGLESRGSVVSSGLTVQVQPGWDLVVPVAGFGGPPMPAGPPPSQWERWTEPLSTTGLVIPRTIGPNFPLLAPSTFLRIGHALFALLFAGVCGLIARHFWDEAEAASRGPTATASNPSA